MFEFVENNADRIVCYIWGVCTPFVIIIGHAWISDAITSYKRKKDKGE